MGCIYSKGSGGPPPAHVLYCRLPEGVHSHMLAHVDLKKLSKLIKRGRLAPLYPHELEQADTVEVRRTGIGAYCVIADGTSSPLLLSLLRYLTARRCDRRVSKYRHMSYAVATRLSWGL
jgi:hypothetical protein